MKTREWLFTIAIVILIQFIVQVGALIYSSDNNILNYISFAGTIVSIILATIAIVYSFVQTISQQSSASNISNQVDKLISVVGIIDESKNTIKNSIEHLNKSSEKLDIAIENQTKLTSKVETISNNFSIEKLTRALNSESTIKNNEHYDTASLSEKIFIAGGNALITVAISLHQGTKLKIPEAEIVQKIITPSAKKALNLTEDETSINTFHQGMFASGFQALASFGLITTQDNNTYTLSNEFQVECENQILKSQESNDYSNEFTKKIISEIIKITEYEAP